MSTEPCGPPEAHFSDWSADELDAAIEPIEIVESIELEGAIDEGSETVEVMALDVAPIDTAVAVPAVEPVAEAALSIAIETLPPPELAEIAAADDASDDDPYAIFIRTLAEVAVASGATMDAATIDALLESDAVATAWRAILRGESEDFSKCAATLDEWAASALASILSAPQKAAQLRRELRARGVAAFGLIDAA